MCSYCRPDDNHVILGFSNGILRIHRLTSRPIKATPFFNWQLDDFWLLSLHDAHNGAIREIYPIDTVFGHLILTCAADGSILIHEVNE